MESELKESQRQKEIYDDFRDRAKEERKAGGLIKIDEKIPTIYIELSDGDTYSFEGEDAQELLDEVPEDFEPEDYILALAQGW